MLPLAYRPVAGMYRGDSKMALAVTIVDETTTGEIVRKTQLRLVSERLTLRELITQRIRAEVEKFNAQREHDLFVGLVQPTDTERKLNGYRLRKPRLISYDEQLALALRAFESNGYVVLIDDKQVDGLETAVTLTEHSKIGFLKLVPLVGG